MRVTLCIIAMFFLTSCGGGGGSSTIPLFAGVWDAVVMLTRDGCAIDGIPQSMPDVLTINQMDAQITVEDQNGNVSTGTTDSSDSFTATDAGVQFNDRCSGVGTTRLFDLDGNQAKASFVFDLNCGGDLNCSIEYKSGTATRR